LKTVTEDVPRGAGRRGFLVHLTARDYVKQKRYGNQEKEQDESDSAGVEAHHQKKPAAELLIRRSSRHFAELDHREHSADL
jgi:hypothetical protein